MLQAKCLVVIQLLARYDKSDDRTGDRSGRVVGNGDQRLRELGER
jgi:hypothetical protein